MPATRTKVSISGPLADIVDIRPTEGKRDKACPDLTNRISLASPLTAAVALQMQYLISWIECLASPLPSQFPPGLQIVRISPVLR
jgi:hypothetical protein